MFFYILFVVNLFKQILLFI